ncbi:MAG TPA: choice-of-anchor Q domain-containing protein, partial [Pyrinomonadaceae bacterium]|nr:choice-of-anchor Q domain-containing protein [Pyrinomonadaceae bacterium]
MNLISPSQRVYAYVTRTVLFFLVALAVLIFLPDRLSNRFWPLAQAATTFTVNSLSDTPDAVPGNGVCADGGGACTLRAALQEANALAGDDTINFSVTGTINLTGALPDITSNININGTGSAVLTVRRDTGGDYRIFFLDNHNVSISGMTITNGKSPDGAAGSGQPGRPGGGIWQAGGSLTLTDVVITANRTGNGATIGNNNTAGWGGSGGGIEGSGVLTMTNVDITNNITGNGATGFSGGTGGSGGGLSFSGSVLTMTNVRVTGNQTGNAGTTTSGGLGGNGGSGGGMHVTATTLNFSHVNVDNNTAGDGDDGGDAGGLFLVSGVATIVNSTFSNNSTGQGSNKFAARGGIGGGIWSLGQITMSGCLISGNSTKATARNDGTGGGPGGGISNGNTLTMVNSTVSGNQASPDGGRGGGIFNSANALTLTNVTITGNSAYTCCNFHQGQGVDNGNVTIARNTIIAGNGDPTVPDVTGIFESQGHNLIGKATAGGNGNNGDQTGFTNGVNGDQVGTLAAPIDPKLGPLADNGGLTRTHKLLAGSSAVDTGDNTLAKDAANNTLRTDQRGAGRFNGIVDIGAFEYHLTLENVTDKSTNQNTALDVSFSVGDSLTNVTVTATSNNQALVPDANLLITGTGTVRTIRITPAPNQTGST